MHWAVWLKRLIDIYNHHHRSVVSGGQRLLREEQEEKIFEMIKITQLYKDSVSFVWLELGVILSRSLSRVFISEIQRNNISRLIFTGLNAWGWTATHKESDIWLKYALFYNPPWKTLEQLFPSDLWFNLVCSCQGARDDILKYRTGTSLFYHMSRCTFAKAVAS